MRGKTALNIHVNDLIHTTAKCLQTSSKVITALWFVNNCNSQSCLSPAVAWQIYLGYTSTCVTVCCPAVNSCRYTLSHMSVTADGRAVVFSIALSYVSVWKWTLQFFVLCSVLFQAILDVFRQAAKVTLLSSQLNVLEPIMFALLDVSYTDCCKFCIVSTE